MFRSLRSSLLAIGLAGLIAAVAMLSEALWSFAALDRSAREAMVAKDVVADILPPPMYLIELRLTLSRAVEGTLAAEQAAKEVDRLQAEYEQRVDYWTANPPFGLEQHLLGKQHDAARRLIVAARSEVLDKLRATDDEGARRGLLVVDELYLAHRSFVDVTVKAANDFAQRSIAAFESRRTRGNWIMIALAAALVLAMAWCYSRARRSILRPVEECVRLASAVAAGDLTCTGETKRVDELGTLRRTLGEMSARLASLIENVRSGVQAMATTTAQIAQGNEDLSARTQEQAAALEQTASSMEEMTATVKQNAENAAAANELAARASSGAERGGVVVKNTIQAMQGITDSSRRMQDIIGVIDEIAFQTNLLALNAAVEAARAGEQGRGFAVVASEVRNLAQRSARAAKEIKQLIVESVDKVEAGAKLVDESGRTLAEIVDSVKRVGAIVAEIAAASEEQSRGIAHATDALTQMDTTTQQNAALVDEAAAASSLMRERAQELAQQMQFFRTDVAQPDSGPSAARMAPPGGARLAAQQETQIAAAA